MFDGNTIALAGMIIATAVPVWVSQAKQGSQLSRLDGRVSMLVRLCPRCYDDVRISPASANRRPLQPAPRV
jgi:hypothetical protein